MGYCRLSGKAVHYKNIKEITPQGLYYIDEGDTHYIDFLECRKNFVNYVNSSNDFTITDLKEIESKCVAWRCMLQIEFFSEPRIKIIIPYKKTLWERITKRNSRKCTRIYLDLLYRIRDNGWSTFDLS
ncbi:hypothetical protein [Paenibacillus sp. P36]|uniref:hypothetical protein n=1 Tax=Paenibacillus sp. P36 TaxID=3342538 RepID=UPI0038B33825